MDSELRKNSNLLHDLKVRDSQFKSFERKSIIQEELEKKLATSKVDLTKEKMEKKGLLDTVASLKRTYTILNDSKKAEKEHTEVTLKLRLATQENEHAVSIGQLKLQIKEKVLEASSFQSEIKRLNYHLL